VIPAKKAEFCPPVITSFLSFLVLDDNRFEKRNNTPILQQCACPNVKIVSPVKKSIQKYGKIPTSVS
jgi:hypothetical protein